MHKAKKKKIKIKTLSNNHFAFMGACKTHVMLRIFYEILKAIIKQLNANFLWN